MRCLFHYIVIRCFPRYIRCFFHYIRCFHCYFSVLILFDVFFIITGANTIIFSALFLIFDASLFGDHFITFGDHFISFGASFDMIVTSFRKGPYKLELVWGKLERKNKDRPQARTPDVVFYGCPALSKPSSYCFALTSMSLRDLPLSQAF